MMQALPEERTDRSLHQTRGSRRRAGSASSCSPRTPQPAYRFTNRSIYGLAVQMLQKAIQGREIGHTFGELQVAARKRQESDFGPRASPLIANNTLKGPTISNSHGCIEDVNRARWPLDTLQQAGLASRQGASRRNPR